MKPRIQKVVDELREWCDQGRGRRVRVAEAIGIHRQVVTHWFAGRQGPTADQCFAVVEFLKKERRDEKRRAAGAAEISFDP
jgi:hypothetical protein